MSEQLALAPSLGGPDRDTVYTPDALAQACVARLVEDDWLPLGGCVVEPSVGGGAFARALTAHGYRVVGVDRDPRAQGGRFCDLYLPATWESACASGVLREHYPVAVVGNPPFGGPRGSRSYIGARHALLACDVAAVGAMLLPASWGVYYGADDPSPADLWTQAGRPPTAVYPVRGRPWGDRLREIALFVWERRRLSEPTRLLRPIEWR